MKTNIKRIVSKALIGVSAIMLSNAAQAVVLKVGDTARVNYAPGSFGPGTPPFAFIALGFNFSSANPFGKNEALTYSVFTPTNTLIGSGSVSSGNSIYTSGLFSALTVSVFPSTPLNATAFYAIVGATTGSFDLIGGQADLYNFSGGTSEFAAIGTVAPAAGAVPEPSTWLMMMLGFGAMAFMVRKQMRRPLAMVN